MWHKDRTTTFIDVGILLLSVVLSTWATLFFSLGFLATTLLYFGLPSAYVLARRGGLFRKAFYTAVLMGLVWGFAFNFLAEINDAWSWSQGNTLLFPEFILGVVSLDIVIWFFLWVFSAILVYEFLFDRHESKAISAHFKFSFISGLIFDLILVVAYLTYPEVLRFRYAYLVLGVFALWPLLYYLYRKPRLIAKAFKIAPFFMLLYLAHELTALNAGLWIFPGEYIGWVEIAHIRFPLEEALFWIVLSSGVAVCYHELFVDDGK